MDLLAPGERMRTVDPERVCCAFSWRIKSGGGDVSRESFGRRGFCALLPSVAFSGVTTFAFFEPRESGADLLRHHGMIGRLLFWVGLRMTSSVGRMFCEPKVVSILILSGVLNTDPERALPFAS